MGFAAKAQKRDITQWRNQYFNPSLPNNFLLRRSAIAKGVVRKFQIRRGASFQMVVKPLYGLDFLGGLGRKYGGTLLNSDLHTTPVDNLSLPTKLTHVC
jgi:hypothetical protein